MSRPPRMAPILPVTLAGVLAALVLGCDREPEAHPADAMTAATPATRPFGFGGWPTTQPWFGAASTAPSAHDTWTGTSPVAPPADRTTEPFRPLVDAVVGEWAVYAAMYDRRIRYDIVEVGPETVTTKVTVFEQGKPLGLPAIREDPRDADLLADQAHHAQRRQRMTPTEAAGRRWDVTLYEDLWTDEDVRYVRRTWVSADAPVFGVVRMELHGDGVLEARLKLVEAGANAP